jgi:hypothetical protein
LIAWPTADRRCSPPTTWREFRIIAAVGTTGFLFRPRRVCVDDTVNGSPFYDGPCRRCRVDSQARAAAMTVEQRRSE